MYMNRIETEYLLNKLVSDHVCRGYNFFRMADIEHTTKRSIGQVTFSKDLFLNPMSIIRWARNNGFSAKKRIGPHDVWEFTKL